MIRNSQKINVLVVGGAGYIGGAITDVLLAKKISFSVYDKLVYEHQYMKPVDFIYGDIRDYKRLKSILPKYTHIIWLAAIVGDPGCQIDEWMTRAVNVEPVKWLVKNYKGRILFASTCSVYGKSVSMLDELSPTQPLSLYAKSKLEVESVLAKHPNVLIYRVGTAYGVSDHHSRIRLDLAVNLLSFKAVNEGKLTYFGGTQWRPFIHVKDIARAFVNGLGSSAKGIYNLTTENSQIKDLAKKIGKLTNCKVEATEQPFQDERNYHVDTDKAKKAGLLKGLKYNLGHGIKEMATLASLNRASSEEPVHFNEKHLAGLMKDNKKIWKK
ncbi:MAG: NAD(P)-dependent oxidoreductase [Candidatus Yanofskybacteria bacterium]|nr:NAD(P)-dependent oxidoreductase [Candidatus Yanofskybacteria bacterium]